VTFRVKAEVLSPHERRIVVEHLKDGDGKFYKLLCACVMPDHVHLILRPQPDLPLSKVMKGIKGVTARKLNAVRGAGGSVWQDESWDRVLRDRFEFDEKLLYMLENPVKQGLVSDGWEYDGWYFNPTE